MSWDFEGANVYLSGPMTGKPDWNRAEFARVEEWCFAHGADEVFNPARDAPHGEDSHTHEHWMLRSLHELTRWEGGTASEDNAPHYRYLVQLDDWGLSRGAVRETATAMACGITCRTLRELRVWDYA